MDSTRFELVTTSMSTKYATTAPTVHGGENDTVSFYPAFMVLSTGGFKTLLYIQSISSYFDLDAEAALRCQPILYPNRQDFPDPIKILVRGQNYKIVTQRYSGDPKIIIADAEVLKGYSPSQTFFPWTKPPENPSFQFAVYIRRLLVQGINTNVHQKSLNF